jgi:hypothetical protein
MEVLPDLEQALPDSSQLSSFWQGVDARELAEAQGVRPVDDFDALLGGWPDDESVDDFISSVRQWRRQNLAEVDA